MDNSIQRNSFVPLPLYPIYTTWKNRGLPIILAVLILYLGCSGPSEYFEKGQYEKAYKVVLKDLEKGKDSANNKKILAASLVEIIREDTEKKERLQASDRLEDQGKAIQINKALQKKIGDAQTFLTGDFDEIYENLIAEEHLLKAKLSKSYFERGKEHLTTAERENDKSQARIAYADFEQAKYYGMETIELERLRKKSYALGQVSYVVEASTDFDITYEWEIDAQFDDLEGSYEFKNVLYEPISLSEEVDCLIEINFRGLDFSEEENTEEETFTQEIVTGTKIIINAAGEEEEVSETEEVEAIVRIKSIIKTAEWSVFIDVDGTKNCDLIGTSFQEELTSSIERIELEGDERAIPENYTNLINEELMSDDDMAEELIELLYDQVHNYLSL